MPEMVAQKCQELAQAEYHGDRLGHAIWLTARHFGVPCEVVQSEINMRINQRAYELACKGA